MVLDILKAFIIGVCASVPLGPIAILVMQKSLTGGHSHGFITGLGSTIVDTLFAVIAIFALAFAESFLDTHNTVILLVGGLIVAVLGFTMAFRDPFRKMSHEKSRNYSMGDFFQAVFMGISNPGAIAVIFFLFAFFDIKLEHHDFRIAPVLMALAGGSAFYWFCFSWLFSHLRNSFKMVTLIWINRISGIIVMIIGISLLAEGVMKISFL